MTLPTRWPREDGLLLDMAGFERALGEQKERSRTDRRTKKEASRPESIGIAAGDLKNVFTGYETLESEATILAIMKEGQPVEEMEEGDEGHMFFDRTPFYGEAGGQAGDDGVMETDAAVAEA